MTKFTLRVLYNANAFPSRSHSPFDKSRNCLSKLEFPDSHMTRELICCNETDYWSDKIKFSFLSQAEFHLAPRLKTVQDPCVEWYLGLIEHSEIKRLTPHFYNTVLVKTCRTGLLSNCTLGDIKLNLLLSQKGCDEMYLDIHTRSQMVFFQSLIFSIFGQLYIGTLGVTDLRADEQEATKHTDIRTQSVLTQT